VETSEDYHRLSELDHGAAYDVLKPWQHWWTIVPQTLPLGLNTDPVDQEPYAALLRQRGNAGMGKGRLVIELDGRKFIQFARSRE
jgi:hypothetical protein